MTAIKQSKITKQPRQSRWHSDSI